MHICLCTHNCVGICIMYIYIFSCLFCHTKPSCCVGRERENGLTDHSILGLWRGEHSSVNVRCYQGSWLSGKMLAYTAYRAAQNIFGMSSSFTSAVGSAQLPRSLPAIFPYWEIQEVCFWFMYNEPMKLVLSFLFLLNSQMLFLFAKLTDACRVSGNILFWCFRMSCY